MARQQPSRRKWSYQSRLWQWLYGPSLPRDRRRRPALRVEELEVRVTPATFVVNSLADPALPAGYPGDLGTGSFGAPPPLLLVGVDGGAGTSLRMAVARANASPGADTITFSPLLRGTLTLANGQMRLEDDVEIAGPGAGTLTVSGNHASRTFTIDAGVTASLSGLTIADGYAPAGLG